MSGLINAIGKVFKKVVNVVKKIAPYIAIAAAVYFTAGAALAAAPAAGAAVGGAAAATGAASGVAATSTLGTVLSSAANSAMIGGALGGGTALLRGQDPLQGMLSGAVMGGVTGGVGAGLGLTGAATGATEAAAEGATAGAEAAAATGTEAATAGIDAAGAGATSTGSLATGPVVTAGSTPAMPFSTEGPSMLNANVGSPTVIGGTGSDPITSSTDMLGRYTLGRDPSVIDQSLAQTPSDGINSTYSPSDAYSPRGLLPNATQSATDNSGGGVMGWVERNQNLVGGVVRGLGEGLMRGQAQDYTGMAQINAQSAADQRAAISNNYATAGRGLIQNTGVTTTNGSGHWIFDRNVGRYVFVPYTAA